MVAKVVAQLKPPLTYQSVEAQLVARLVTGLKVQSLVGELVVKFCG